MDQESIASRVATLEAGYHRIPVPMQKELFGCNVFGHQPVSFDQGLVKFGYVSFTYAQFAQLANSGNRGV